MSRRCCIALLCLVVAGAVCARPDYDEHPHRYAEYRRGDGQIQTGSGFFPEAKQPVPYFAGVGLEELTLTFGGSSAEQQLHLPSCAAEQTGLELKEEYEPRHAYYRTDEGYHADDDDERYVSLTLQEVRVQDLLVDENKDYSYRAFFTCGVEKESARECGQSLDYKKHSDSNFLQDAILPNYAASCLVQTKDADPDGDTSLCAIKVCLQIEMTCAVSSSAKECGCPVEDGFTFNATGNFETLKALSCSPSYATSDAACDNTPGNCDKRSTSKKAAHSKKGRTLLAENSAEYAQPHNGTVYSGTAIVVNAHVTASSTGGGYDHELNHQLKHAKIEYVAGFLNGVAVSDTDEDRYSDDRYSDDRYSDEGGYRKQMPFVTGGLLKIIMKKLG